MPQIVFTEDDLLKSFTEVSVLKRGKMEAEEALSLAQEDIRHLIAKLKNVSTSMGDQEVDLERIRTKESALHREVEGDKAEIKRLHQMYILENQRSRQAEEKLEFMTRLVHESKVRSVKRTHLVTDFTLIDVAWTKLLGLWLV